MAASASTGSRTSLDLGDEIEVRVDDVDPNGKVSLRLAGEPLDGDGRRRPRRAAAVQAVATPRAGHRRSDAPAEASSGDREYVSFEDAFDDEVAAEFGDLGPGRPPAVAATVAAGAAAGAAVARSQRWRRSRRPAPVAAVTAPALTGPG